tara:strand:+ start:4280 stop:4882 length:603 start_codon:yes stop_codon:yes gene_type:complete
MTNIIENHPKQLENLNLICGIDEVGRGCLAGPVYASAVILPKNFTSEIIKDSKKLSEKKRLLAFDEIKENALYWSFGYVTPKEIDDINIQNATHLAMHKAVNGLGVIPEHLLVDGNTFENYKQIPHTCVIKGDNKFLPIAAASIVAKVIRDKYMSEIHNNYPHYKWDSNKGYGSKYHIDSILSNGTTPHHRNTFLRKILS